MNDQHNTYNQWLAEHGYQPALGPPQVMAVPTQGNGLAVASLVLGITSIIFSWWGLFTLAQVVLAIVFGSAGLYRANRGAPNKGLAIAGLVLGLIGGAIYFVFGLLTLGAGWVI
jgi:ABC-type phosphate transport system permease subunit